MLTAIERNSLAVEVVHKLQMEILAGNIKPGQKLLEQELSSMMKTSRGPVRDALFILEHEGLVIREYNRSAIVVRMTASDVEEVSSLRLCLEQLALKYAIEKASEEDIERLEELVKNLRMSLKKNSTATEAVDLDLQFHEEFVKSSKHNRLLLMWQSIKTQIRFLILTRNAFNIHEFERAADNHEDLLDAIRNKNIEKGMKVLQVHDDRSYARLIACYSE